MHGFSSKSLKEVLVEYNKSLEQKISNVCADENIENDIQLADALLENEYIAENSLLSIYSLYF